MVTTAKMISSRRIERDSPLPLYVQLKDLLLEPIENGTWKPGELIPGEQELQMLYGLSRTTVRQALSELEIDGKVSRHRGRGTFVSTPKLTHSPQPKASLTDSLLARGMKPGWRVISHAHADTPADLSQHLGLRPTQPAWRLVRLRLANDEPIGVHIAFVAPKFLDSVDETKLDSGGSLDYLNLPDLIATSRADRVIEAVAARGQEQELLEVEAGAPMLRIRRVVTSAAGEPIEVMVATYRGDRFEYRFSSDA